MVFSLVSAQHLSRRQPPATKPGDSLVDKVCTDLTCWPQPRLEGWKERRSGEVFENSQEELVIQSRAFGINKADRS